MQYQVDKNTNNKILIGTNEPDSSCARYLRWYDGLELEDVTGLETNSDYQFDAYEGRVYFYGTDRNLKVKVKGNFEDWIRNVTGRVTKTITGYGELTPYGDEIEVKNFNWCIVHEGPKYDTWWLNWGDKKIASDDKGYYLVVKADIKELGEDFKTKPSPLSPIPLEPTDDSNAPRPITILPLFTKYAFSKLREVTRVVWMISSHSNL